MVDNPSLVKRIAIGKGVGLVVGLIGFFTLPQLWPEAGLMIRWGVLLWYVTLGAIIAVYGVITWHPILDLPLPWWVRSPLVGAWMNFVLTFFAYDTMQTMMLAVFGTDGFITSPFWFVAEGAIIGAIIGYTATRFGGEGAALVGEMDR
ncbi:MAG: hypothetical protein HQ481_13400 [Alphaproteobacteria bacterium]|nr:hypothetical protein [Alphaproteobacteria bacterium]